MRGKALIGNLFNFFSFLFFFVSFCHCSIMVLLLVCIALRSYTLSRCTIVGMQSHKDRELNRLFDKMTMMKSSRNKVAFFIIIA